MKIRHFDSSKQEKEYDAKSKLRRNNFIALCIIVPVLVLALFLKLNRIKVKYSEFFKAIRNGGIFEAEFFALIGVIAVITTIICIIFRKKEHSRATLIKGAVTVATGIVLIGIFVFMCVKSI